MNMLNLIPDNVRQQIHFWGSIASLIAVTLTIVSGVIWYFRRQRKQIEEEQAELEELQERIAERTRKATTQGKRTDLFIYYQSVLSQKRMRQLMRLVILISALNGVFLLLVLAKLYEGKSSLHYWICLLTALTITLLDARFSKTFLKNQKRLDATARSFTDTLDEHIDK